MSWKASRYTHLVALAGGDGAVYNGRTGAVLKLSPGAFERCKAIICSAPSGCSLSAKSEADHLFKHLIAGGFLVDSGLDELAALEHQYRSARQRSQFMLTILPTFACNLGCAYCFTGKKSGTMSKTCQNAVIRFVQARFAAHLLPSMAVDWLGGEPLLALDVIEYLSEAFLRLCERNHAEYRAQVITNGTMLSDRAVEVLSRAGVDRLQVTLDGLREIHDQRRPSKVSGISSFDRTVTGLERAIGRFVIRLRINVDRRNLGQAWPLLDCFAERGWLGPQTKFYPYLARVTPFTDSCAWVAPDACDLEAFQEANIEWVRQLHRYGVPAMLQGLYQFPEPRSYTCGAVGKNGFVIAPNGDVHKCGLAADDATEAIGTVGGDLEADGHNTQKWKTWNPFAIPACRDCAHLPSCLGGCPRNHLRRSARRNDNCLYYQRHENRMLAVHLNLVRPATSTPTPQRTGRVHQERGR